MFVLLAVIAQMWQISGELGYQRRGFKRRGFRRNVGARLNIVSGQTIKFISKG